MLCLHQNITIYLCLLHLIIIRNVTDCIYELHVYIHKHTVNIYIQLKVSVS